MDKPKEICLSIIERTKRDVLIPRYQKEISSFLKTDIFIYYCNTAELDIKKTTIEILKKGKLWVELKKAQKKWEDL